ncbi:MAG: hypothetical protein R3F14_21740 [Polyangiaceae bacterium]
MGTKTVAFLGAAGLAVWALSGAGCVLDWTVPQGDGGGGTGGIFLKDVTCKLGDPCVCPEADACNMDCSSKDCDVTCGAGSFCALSCNTASCNLSCEPGSACDVDCASGSCIVECKEEASCTVMCPASAVCSCTGAGCDCVGIGCQ